MRVRVQEHSIPVSFVGNTIYPSADIDISVFSRKIKFLDPPPSHIFFRTHQYEFRIQPNEIFYKFIEDGISKNNRDEDVNINYFVKLTLMNKSDNKELRDINKKSLIDFSFEERSHDNPPWIVRVNFVSSKCFRWISSNYSSSAELYWKFDVYKYSGDDFKWLLSKYSNIFYLYSKPEVLYRQIGIPTTKKLEEQEDNESCNDNLAIQDNQSLKRKRKENSIEIDQSRKNSKVEDVFEAKQYQNKIIRSSFVENEVDTGFNNIPKPSQENDVLSLILSKPYNTPSIEMSPPKFSQTLEMTPPKFSQDNQSLSQDYFGMNIKNTPDYFF